MLNLKPQQKTPDWPGFSPFFFVFSTQSYLFLFFHEMDGDDETVRFEKEVCTKKLLLCTLKLNSILHVETNRFSATFWLYGRALVNVFQFWQKLPKTFFPVCASSTPSETQFSKARRLEILGGMALAISWCKQLFVWNHAILCRNCEILNLWINESSINNCTTIFVRFYCRPLNSLGD